jgi:signal transduction histidine kinase/CheY-like chemotaxis protein
MFENNSFIVRTYLRLLSRHYKHIEQDALLDYAGISRQDIAVSKENITNHKLRRFFERAVHLTENPNLAREVGRFYMSIDVAGFKKNYLLSILPPRFIFAKLSCVLKDISSPCKYKAKWHGQNKVDVFITPLHHELENKFHCSQRKGVIEALVESFSGSSAQIETHTCSCKGNNYCHYTVSWPVSKQLRWKRFWFSAAVALPVANLISYFFYPEFVVHKSLPTSAIILLILSLIVERTGKAHLQESMAAISDICDREQHALAQTRGNNELIAEIGHALSVANANTQQGATIQIIQILQKRLQFDRAIILLRSEENKDCLHYSASYGFDQETQNLIESRCLSLKPGAPDYSCAVLRKCIIDLAPSVQTGAGRRPLSSLEDDWLLNAIQAHTYVCCPILNDGDVLGVLYVDVTVSDRIITNTDVNLISAIASFLGIILVSASTHNKLNLKLQEAQKQKEIQDERERNLEEEIDRKTQSLREAVIRSEDAAQTKSQFLANMSHEIRTPLYGIIGSADLLAEKLNDADNLKQIQTIQREGKSLQELINQILDLSKLEAGQTDIGYKELDIRGLISEVLELYSYMAKTKNISLNASVDKNIPALVLGDEIRLGQIFKNLVTNAIKFTEKGAIEVKAILQSAGEHIASIEFFVKDTGIGMDADKQKSIFESFCQGSTEISQKYGGTGLGLSICKHLVEAMGGHINVTSTPGVGSEFVFNIVVKKVVGGKNTEYLPLKKHSTSFNSKDKTSRRILIVDDNETTCDISSQFLTRDGNEVLTAESADQAYSILSRGKVDLVFMDIQMPGTDGLEATQYIRKNFGYTTPVVALTASPSAKTIKAAYEHGMNHVVGKPVKRADLRCLSYVWGEPKDSHEIHCHEHDDLVDKNELLFEFEDNLQCVDQACRQYIASANTELARAYKWAYSGDMEALAKLAHKMKGSSGLLCAPGLANAWLQLEDSVKAGNIQEINRSIQCAQCRTNRFMVECKNKGMMCDDIHILRKRESSDYGTEAAHFSC